MAKARMWRESKDDLLALSDDFDTYDVMRRVLAPDSNCADVGASVGLILGRTLGFAPQGNHFAFEPRPAAFATLHATFGHLTSVHLYQSAVGSCCAKMPFAQIVDDPGCSGFRERPGVAGRGGVDEIEVDCVRLDDIVDVPLRLMKVDVEGAELDVFRGASQVLQRDHPFIVFEHGWEVRTFTERRLSTSSIFSPISTTR